MKDGSKNIKSVLRFLEMGFIDGKKSEGGDISGFRGYVSNYCDNNQEEVISLAKEAWLATTPVVWSEKSSQAKSGDTQFNLDGLPVPKYITFKDAAFESGYAKVSIKYATVAQFGLSWMLKQKHANEAIRSADEHLAQYELLQERSGGDEQALIIDLLDAEEKVA